MNIWNVHEEELKTEVAVENKFSLSESLYVFTIDISSMNNIGRQCPPMYYFAVLKDGCIHIPFHTCSVVNFLNSSLHIKMGVKTGPATFNSWIYDIIHITFFRVVFQTHLCLFLFSFSFEKEKYKICFISNLYIWMRNFQKFCNRKYGLCAVSTIFNSNVVSIGSFMFNRLNTWLSLHNSDI